MNNKKNTVLKAVSLILLILVLCFIFGMSSMKGDASGSLSEGMLEKIVTFIFPSLKGNDDFFGGCFFYIIHGVVRKIAHFTMFMTVGFLSSLHLSCYKLKNKAVTVASALFSLAAASFDELHQLFVFERSAQITDVLIDFFGALCGILIIYLIVLKKRRK